QLELEVERDELEQARHGAVGAPRGGADAAGELDGVGRVLVPQRQHRAAAARELDRFALVAAGGAEQDAGLALAGLLRRLRGELAADARLLHRIVIAELRLPERQALDAQARLLVLLRQVEQPVLAAV